MRILAAIVILISVSFVAVCTRSSETPSTEIQGPAKIELAVTGMTCAACVTKITTALRAIQGVGFAHVSLSKSLATVLVGKEQSVSREALIAGVRGVGAEYSATITSAIAVPATPR